MTTLQRLESTLADIEVWLLAFNFTKMQLAWDWLLLSAEERARAQRFHQLQDQVRFVSSRAVLRRLLAEHIDASPEQLRFMNAPQGKPYLPHYPDLQFNLSHAGNYALIAISTRGAIGIDIESRRRDTAGLAEYVLSPLERTKACWPSLHFIDLWVAKEAILKALGLGIAEYLQAISVLPDQGNGYRVVHENPNWGNINVCPVDVPAYYSAALAWVPKF